MTTTQSTEAHHGACAGRREWFGLSVLALGALITSIDVSVAILALPMISETLHANSTEQLWILDSYGFLMAGLMVTFGSLAVRIGRRTMAMESVLQRCRRHCSGCSPECAAVEMSGIFATLRTGGLGFAACPEKTLYFAEVSGFAEGPSGRRMIEVY